LCRLEQLGSILRKTEISRFHHRKIQESLDVDACGSIWMNASEILASRQLEDQAEIARAAGIPRARVTQIINLTNLAPDIQQAILDLEPTTDHVPRCREGEVRQIAITPNWEKQRLLWKRLS
jgi:hypothetical protein